MGYIFKKKRKKKQKKSNEKCSVTWDIRGGVVHSYLTTSTKQVVTWTTLIERTEQFASMSRATQCKTKQVNEFASKLGNMNHPDMNLFSFQVILSITMESLIIPLTIPRRQRSIHILLSLILFKICLFLSIYSCCINLMSIRALNVESTDWSRIMNQLGRKTAVNAYHITIEQRKLLASE